MMHEIWHVTLKFIQEEIRKLQEKHPYYAKLIEDRKLKNKRSKEDPLRTLYKKV